MPEVSYDAWTSLMDSVHIKTNVGQNRKLRLSAVPEEPWTVVKRMPEMGAQGFEGDMFSGTMGTVWRTFYESDLCWRRFIVFLYVLSEGKSTSYLQNPQFVKKKAKKIIKIQIDCLILL